MRPRTVPEASTVSLKVSAPECRRSQIRYAADGDAGPIRKARECRIDLAADDDPVGQHVVVAGLQSGEEAAGFSEDVDRLRETETSRRYLAPRARSRSSSKYPTHSPIGRRRRSRSSCRRNRETALAGVFVVGVSSAAARSADATAMSAPTESAPTSAHGEQATRRKKLRSMRANGPQCDIPVVPEHCRIGSVNLQLKGIWVVPAPGCSFSLGGLPNMTSA